MNPGDFAPKTVRLMFEIREDSSCFYCRRGLTWEGRGMSWSAHHRKPRGTGGTRDTAIGRISNGIVLCGSGTTGCHGWVESHRAEASDAGLLMSRLGSDDPVNVPVRRADGSWWWLTAWGSAVPYDMDVPF